MTDYGNVFIPAVFYKKSDALPSIHCFSSISISELNVCEPKGCNRLVPRKTVTREGKGAHALNSTVGGSNTLAGLYGADALGMAEESPQNRLTIAVQ